MGPIPSRWANTCLKCSSSSHRRGHLSLHSDQVSQWPRCSWAARALLCVYEWVFFRSLYSEWYFEWVFSRQTKKILLSDIKSLLQHTDVLQLLSKTVAKKVLRWQNQQPFPSALFNQIMLSETLHSEAYNSFGDFSPQNESLAQLMALESWILEGKCCTLVNTLSFSLKRHHVSAFLFSCIKPQTIIFFWVTLGPLYNAKSI